MSSQDVVQLGLRTGDAADVPLSAGEWLRYGPFLAHLVIIRRCNLSCGYCNEYDDHSPPVPYEVLERRLRKLRALRTWMLCMTGGEPTLHPDLPRLVRRATELGFRRRQIITNGYRLTRRLVEALNDAGLSDLQISVDGVKRNPTTVKVLDPLRGRLRTLARTARFKVVVSAVIGSAPPAEALEVVRFARAEGLTPRIILLHDGSGRLQLSGEDRAAYREVKQMLGRAGRESGDYRQRLLDQGAAPFRCRSGARYLYVDEHGQVHWCSQTIPMFTKDLLSYSLDDLRQQFHAQKPCSAGCTVGCARTASSYEEWRGQGQ
ncbi:MAG TPA: radical SAM protein [Myxococcales bacterium]|nr:radical SAM protein [Myxococcales bacterium]